MASHARTHGNYTLVNDPDAGIRGDVYDGKRPVVASFKSPVELTSSEELRKLYPDAKPSDFEFHYLAEGTVVRLRYDSKALETVFSTRGNTRAYEASWGARRFGVAFEAYLTKSRTVWPVEAISTPPMDDYVFILLLSDPENRLVTGSDEIEVTHLATLAPVYEADVHAGWKRINVDIGFPAPTSLVIETWDELDRLIESALDHKRAGVVAMWTDPTKLDTFNLRSRAWLELSELRGNSPHLVKRYLELLATEPEEAEQLAAIFVEHSNVLKPLLPIELGSLAGLLWDVYRERYIRHQFVTIAPASHRFLHKRVLAWSIKQRERQAKEDALKPPGERRHFSFLVSSDVILGMLKTMPPYELNKLLVERSKLPIIV